MKKLTMAKSNSETLEALKFFA